MDKPTEAQIKEFWEWCGFKETSKVRYYDKDKTPYKAWLNPDSDEDNWAYSFPPIDLNNLFEYAVPKLKYFMLSGFPLDETYKVVAMTETSTKRRSDNDPALSLFWAIWKVINADKDKLV